MHRRSRHALLAVVLLAAAGCSDDGPTGPSTPLTPAALAGPWRLVSVQPAGSSDQPVPAGATYTMTVGEASAGLTVDCNVCGGNLAVSGDTVRLGPFVCTLAACPTLSFGNAFMRVVEGEHTGRLSDDTLQLTSSRGTVRFAR